MQQPNRTASQKRAYQSHKLWTHPRRIVWNVSVKFRVKKLEFIVEVASNPKKDISEESQLSISLKWYITFTTFFSNSNDKK